jgi:N-acyl-D-aspartate/D-glutamate deacylase
VSAHYDILILNTRIVDGTGAPAYSGSVGIRGDRIAALGNLVGDATTTIDGSKWVTCPGFVDIHSHADTSILEHPQAENLIMQGITTFVGGNCGFSLAPVANRAGFDRIAKIWGLGLEPTWNRFGEWLDRVDVEKLSLNYVPLVGHNTVRGAVMGEDFRRTATPAEIDVMKGMVAEAMTSGAFGLSVGVDAAWAGHFADVNEIVELAKIAKQYGGLFTPHTRHHQNQWPAAHPDEFGYGLFHAPKGEIIVGRYHGLIEAVEIAKKAGGIRLHIAHLTPAYLIPQPHPAFLDEAAARATLVDIVDRASQSGLDVTYNVVAWPSSIGTQVPIIESFFGERLLLPEWYKALGKEEFIANLRTPTFRQRVKQVIVSGYFKFGMLHPLADPYWMDCYQILRCRNSAYAGKTIGELARQRRPDDILGAVYEEAAEVVFDVLADDPGATWALIMDKREYGALEVFLKHPAGIPASDVQALPAEPQGQSGIYDYGIPPIAYGLFPRFFRVHMREQGLLGLEEAVRKVTGLPAQRVLGLKDRGTLQEGAYADVVVFDPTTIRERADALDPTRPPEGIAYVFVNGTMVNQQGRPTGKRPGMVLRKS